AARVALSRATVRLAGSASRIRGERGGCLVGVQTATARLTRNICTSMHMHSDATKPVRDPGRPDPPPHRRRAAERRETGRRDRRQGWDPPVWRLSPPQDFARVGLRQGATGRATSPLLAPAGAVSRARCVARGLSAAVGSPPRSLRCRARGTTQEPWHLEEEGAPSMSDERTSAAADTAQATVVIERTYRARVEELWELWTTKAGFESWW